MMGEHACVQPEYKCMTTVIPQPIDSQSLHTHGFDRLEPVHLCRSTPRAYERERRIDMAVIDNERRYLFSFHKPLKPIQNLGTITTDGQLATRPLNPNTQFVSAQPNVDVLRQQIASHRP